MIFPILFGVEKNESHDTKIVGKIGRLNVQCPRKPHEKA